MAMAMAGLRLGLWLRYWMGSRLARLRSSDYLLDLGCGDGRLLITAAKLYGAKGYGVELDSSIFAEAKRAISKENLDHMITVEQKDAFDVDLTSATVITLYLSEGGNLKLLPKMKRELSAEARVVSFCWPIPGVKPCRTIKVDGIPIFLYDGFFGAPQV